MRRHAWRFVVVAVLLALGLPVVAPAPAQAAPRAPVQEACSVTVINPEYCAAVRVIEGAWVAMKVGEITGINFESAWDAIGGEESVLALGSGGSIEAAALGICSGSCLDNVATVEYWIRFAAQRMKEAEKQAQEQDVVCGMLGWWFDCPAADPEPFPDWASENGSILGAPDYEGNSWGLQTFGATAMTAVVVVRPEVFTGCPSGGSTLTYSPMDRCWIIATPTVINHSSGADGNSGFGMYGYLDGGFLKIGVADKWGNAGYWGTAASATAASVALGIYLDNDNVFRGMWTSLGSTSSFTQYVNYGGSGYGAYRALLNDQLMGGNAGQVPLVHVRVWRDFDYHDYPSVDLAFREILDLFEPDLTWPEEAPAPDPRPGTEEEPTPTTEADVPLPTVTTIAPEGAPSTGTDAEKEQGLLQNIVEGVASGFNFLLNGIRNLIEWLGDIFGQWIRWLWANLKWLLKSIRDAINSVVDAVVATAKTTAKLLQSVIASIGENLGVLWGILTAIAALPGALADLLVEKLQDLLEYLFVPEDDALDFSAQIASFDASPVGGLKNTIQSVPDAFGNISPSCGSVGPEAYGSKADLCRWSDAGLDFSSGGTMPGLMMRIVQVIVWLAVAIRIVRSLPWSKGRDAGEPSPA